MFHRLCVETMPSICLKFINRIHSGDPKHIWSTHSDQKGWHYIDFCFLTASASPVASFMNTSVS
jgi:hypothetical protein